MKKWFPLTGLLNGLVEEFVWLVSYITNNVFPLPLGEKEEEKLLIRMEKRGSGGQEPLNRAEPAPGGAYCQKFDNPGRIMMT